MLYYMNWLTHDFWTRTGGWEFDRSHGAGTSSPSHSQQVEEQAPKPYEFCYRIYTYIYNGSVIQCWRSCTPSRSIGLYFWAVRGSWAECHFCFLWFTNCVLLLDISLILGCLWPLVYVLNNTLILGIWCSTIPHLPGCFCPWTFFENIGFNTVLTDPFMSHLATQLGYSAGEFQALKLIVLAAFGVVD